MKPNYRAFVYPVCFWTGWILTIIECGVAWGWTGLVLAVGIPLCVIGTAGGFLTTYCTPKEPKP